MDSALSESCLRMYLGDVNGRLPAGWIVTVGKSTRVEGRALSLCLSLATPRNKCGIILFMSSGGDFTAFASWAPFDPLQRNTACADHSRLSDSQQGRSQERLHGRHSKNAPFGPVWTLNSGPKKQARNWPPSSEVSEVSTAGQCLRSSWVFVYSILERFPFPGQAACKSQRLKAAVKAKSWLVRV